MSRSGIAALAVAAWCAGALPAQAQFYSLEGRFECLDDPRAICFDATSDGPMPPSAPAAPPPKPRAVAAAAKTPPLAQAAAHPGEPLHEIAARIQAGRPEPGDAARLDRLAQGGDRRALELLAWCRLKGLGIVRDPVEAFRLYGAAADLGVADARRNQTIVYETVLTSEQRQQVLMAANGIKPTP